MKVESLKIPDFSLSTEKTKEKEKVTFGEMLKDYIQKVMDLEREANREAEKLIRSDSTDLHNVMISIEKADLTFQLMMQIRNKIISAYEEIMRMQV